MSPPGKPNYWKNLLNRISKLSLNLLGQIILSIPSTLHHNLFLMLSLTPHSNPSIDFREVKPNEDLPLEGRERLIILDVVEGIEKVVVITQDNIEQLILPPRSSAHEYDLGFQLKYLQKLGLITDFVVVGIPINKNYNYDSIHLIFKKLVAQDIQGS